MRKHFLVVVLHVFLTFPVWAQPGIIEGTIRDAISGETLIGATMLIQGTTRGTITDLDGKFTLAVEPGSYNLVASYISYDDQIITVDASASDPVQLDLELQPATTDMDEVTIVGQRRTNTEMSVISTLRAGDLIANGISAQQISKTQDSEAAEVVRRVPGITITDGRFVIVRGLIERYNSVLLNGASAPSFESDKKAFSFDAVPSGMIDNILIYKSPAPELPADFAGAAIDIVTKSNADENSLKFDYKLQYTQGASLNDGFQVYKGGKLDRLGFDDGTRAIPSGIPSTEEIKELYNWKNMEDYLAKSKVIDEYSGKFNNNWNYDYRSPFLDQSAMLTLQRRFLIGKVSVGNITVLNYKANHNHEEITRREYQKYEPSLDKMILDFDWNDIRSETAYTTGLIHNWNLIYGRNQKITFNNFFNQMGKSTVTSRQGTDYYDGRTSKGINLRYNSRFIYSGQLKGEYTLNNEMTTIDWLAGFAYTKNERPDDRRSFLPLDPSNDRYYLEIQNNATNQKYSGRLYTSLFERTSNLGVNFEHGFFVIRDQRPWYFKAGAFYEYKYRNYDSRLLGVITPGNQSPVNFYAPLEEIFTEENFFFNETNWRQSGLAYSDGTRIKDSYIADNKLKAGYAALKIPLLGKFMIYGGFRLEEYYRKLTGFYEPDPDLDTLAIIRDTLNIFPSVNVSYNINEKHLLRFSYGKTTNRPEFREISNVAYEDFDMNVLIHGNPDLKDSYTENYDLRYEWYPRLGEMISMAGFYKHFINPIEVFLIPAGTGYDYRPFNTKEATSTGMEIDVRKTFTEAENSSLGPVRFLRNLTLVFNASLIRSKINTDKGFSRDTARIMQGQSPYIVNIGTFYNNPDMGLMVNLVYNRIGKRIAFAGRVNDPHTYELPRNSLDLSVNKLIGEHWELKFGVKDILAEPVRFMQYYKADESLAVPTYKWIPNRKISVGASLRF